MEIRNWRFKEIREEGSGREIEGSRAGMRVERGREGGFRIWV